MRNAARISGAAPVRTRQASSPKLMSRTQCSRFSISQCPARSPAVCPPTPARSQAGDRETVSVVSFPWVRRTRSIRHTCLAPGQSRYPLSRVVVRIRRISTRPWHWPWLSAWSSSVTRRFCSRGGKSRAVHLAGPGRSRDYSLELPQIPTCGLPASGSSSQDFATSAIRWLCGDTGQVSVYLPWFQSTAHETASPSPRQGPSGWFPWINSTMRRSDSLPPISPHFVSFAWRYHRCVRCSSPPAPDAEPWIKRELVGGISGRLARWKRQGLPSSQGNPL